MATARICCVPRGRDCISMFYCSFKITMIALNYVLSLIDIRNQWFSIKFPSFCEKKETKCCLIVEHCKHNLNFVFVFHYSLIVSFRLLAMVRWHSTRKSGQLATVERLRHSQRMTHQSQSIWPLSLATKLVWHTLCVRPIVQDQVSSIRIIFNRFINIEVEYFYDDIPLNKFMVRITDKSWGLC